MVCAICGKEFANGEIATVRQQWLDEGGHGHIPPQARVHIKCDKKERRAKGQRTR